MPDTEANDPLRVVVFGANGPTGRLLTGRLLAEGHDVVAVTRRPSAFPLSAHGLRVVEADATSPDQVSGVLDGAHAVVSVLGTGFSRHPIDLYSRSAQAIRAAMVRNRIRRLVVTSSAALSPWTDPSWGWLERSVGRRVLAALGRTLYEDMARLEQLVSASDLDWTIMRPLGLTTVDAPTTYRIAEDHVPGRQTARHDLAAAIADQLTRSDYVGKTVAVATCDANQGLAQTIWREGLKPQLQRLRGG